MNLNIRMLVSIISFAIYLGIVLSIPLRLNYIMKRTGALKLRIASNKPVLPILILVLCGVLLIIVFFKDLGLYGNMAIFLVSILGSSMGSEELALNNKCGVYENGIIGGGHFLPLKEIYALPILSYSEEDKLHHDLTSLRIITDKKGAVTFNYSSEDECQKVIDLLIELNPSLQ